MNTLNICGNELPVYGWGEAPVDVLERVEIAPDGSKWHMISLPPEGGIMLAKLREKLMQARKAGRADEMSTLQVLIGEITTLEARNIKINDEECERVVRKVIESDKETLSLMKETSSDNAKKLLAEGAMKKCIRCGGEMIRLRYWVRDVAKYKCEKCGKQLTLNTRFRPKKDENMATISKEIRLTLDECKEGIKLFLKERMGVDVHPSDIVFDAVYTSGGHGDNGPPKTTGCTIRFKDEKL